MINNSLHHKGLILIIFFMLSCTLHFDKIFLGDDALIRIHDSFDAEISRFNSTSILLKDHGNFSWFPTISGGMPAYAFHHPPYFILCLLLTFISPLLLNNALAIVNSTFAGFGMYWFLKDYNKNNPGLSFFGGIIFFLITQFDGFQSQTMLVFNFAFPIFAMSLFSFTFDGSSIKLRIFSLVSLIFITSTSSPILTIPFFGLMSLLIVFIYDEENTLIKRGMIIKVIIFWFGYILINIPVIYSLFDYIPFAQRKYSSTGEITTFAWNFLKRSYINSINHGLNSTLLFVMIGFFPLAYYSARVRKVSLLIIVPFIIGTIFIPPIPQFLSGTIFQKMDLSHFYFLLPFSIVVFSITSLSESISNNKVPLRLYCLCSAMGLLFPILFSRWFFWNNYFDLMKTWLNIITFFSMLIIFLINNPYVIDINKMKKIGYSLLVMALFFNEWVFGLIFSNDGELLYNTMIKFRTSELTLAALGLIFLIFYKNQKTVFSKLC